MTLTYRKVKFYPINNSNKDREGEIGDKQSEETLKFDSRNWGLDMHHEVDPGRNSSVGNWRKGSKMKKKTEKERH